MKNTNSNKKVTIVLAHYNQPMYVKQALSSILNQTYDNIELIFADDASTNIDVQDLKKYVKTYNKNNIDVIWQINETNVGTVKNLNKAIEKSSGDYLYFFAADDELYSNDVIERMVNEYEKMPSDVAIIFGQVILMDENMYETFGHFVKENEAVKFNDLPASEQFKKLASDCIVGMGGAMLDANILKQLGNFDETYKYIEDWPYFLKTTLKNYRIIYKDITALKHRDGGISHSEVVTPVRLKYWEELLIIAEKNVLPYLNDFNYYEKNQVLEVFVNNKNNLIRHGGYYDEKKYLKFKLRYLPFFIKRKINHIYKEFNIYKSNTISKICNNSIALILVMNLKIYFNIKPSLLLNLFLIILFIPLIKNIIVLITIYIIKLLKKIRVF